MTARRQRELLKSQLVATEGMLSRVRGHPLMEPSLRSRYVDIQRQLEDLPPAQKEPRTVLFFFGEPVQGSIGIDANFAAGVLAPFQNMVMTEHANRFHGVVGKRGKRVGEAESRLLLTALPRGSFGLELAKADDDEFFEAEQLADTLAYVTKLVESAGRSDEDFASQLEEAAPRAIQSLREFLEAIAKGHAGVTIETGDFRSTLTPLQAVDAYQRVSDTVTQEDEIQLSGVFKGALLESWRFDFTDVTGHKYTGKLDDDITQSRAAEMLRQYTEAPCNAKLLKTTVLFKNGRVRNSYRLLDLISPME